MDGTRDVDILNRVMYILLLPNSASCLGVHPAISIASSHAFDSHMFLQHRTIPTPDRASFWDISKGRTVAPTQSKPTTKDLVVATADTQAVRIRVQTAHDGGGTSGNANFRM